MDIKIRHEGRDISAVAEMINGTLWIHYAGRTRAIEPQTGRRARGRAHGAEASGELRAPMPGKITKLFKKTGDTVERGEAVIVMEAMKMEYTLKADIPGVVEAVHCAVGDQVGLGQDLVKVKPS